MDARRQGKYMVMAVRAALSWTRDRIRAFDLALVPEGALNAALWCYLAFGLITIDVVSNGPLRRLDELIAGSTWQRSSRGLNEVAYVLDHIGQRGLIAPILLIAAIVISRRIGWWRPFRLTVVALLALNISVGAVKVLVGRTSPRSGVDELLAGGFQYVSGHAANAALTWGLLAYLIHRFTDVRPAIKEAATSATIVLVTLMVVVSLYRNTHWLTDLISGVLVGGTLLALVMVIDRGLVRHGQTAAESDADLAEDTVSVAQDQSSAA
jgi:membrane-associated phospholipid phosphatase